MAVALDQRLEKLLVKHGADEKVKAYLLSKNLVLLGQFAGLADSKADVADGICIPAGLDKADRVKCGPVKMAWMEADAYVAAELDQIRRGKFTDLDDPIDPEVRIKKTTNFNDHYHIRLSAHLVGSDSLAGRCVREHDRKTPTAMDVMKVHSLAHKPGSVDKGGDEEKPLNRYRFMYKHRVLMNTLALAVAPDWADADWSVLLDYHEWLVIKLYEERNGHLPPLSAVVDADFQMRTKWIEAVRNDKKVLTEAIKVCRTEWVSLFSDLHDHHGGNQANIKGEKSFGDQSPKRTRRELPRIDVDPNTGKDICTFFNMGKCTYGQRCKSAHVCNVRGCNETHAAFEYHRS